MPPDRPPLTLRRFIAQSVILAVVMLSALSGYLAVLKWRGHDAEYTTKTSWDAFFPFQPAWVWVYLIPYLIGPIIVGLLTPPTFWWYIKRGIVSVLITLLIFIIIPTQTDTRPSHDLEGPTRLLYQWMIEIDDPPANAAPSLHVSLTCLLALALLRDFPRWWPVTLTGVILVWLATLYTRQHHLIDVATGAALALAVVLVWPSRWRRGAKGTS